MRELAEVRDSWEHLATLKAPALAKTPLEDLTTEALFTIADWFNHYRDRVQVKVEANMPWTSEDFDSVWQPVKPWLLAYFTNVINFRSGKKLEPMPERPRFGSEFYDHPKVT